MAGHSQFKNIMYRKGAQDKKRAGLFAKLTREIIVAAKTGGADISANARLRLAVSNARSQSMPKDNIERAIKKATGGNDGDNFEEIRYEGYGPGGIAVIVECLSDNRNRTASDVRSVFGKNGGNLGETGAVSYQFKRVGEIRYSLSVGDEDTVLEAAIDAGGDDMSSDDEAHEIICDGASLHSVSEALEKQFGEPLSSKLIWKADNEISIEDSQLSTLFKLVDALDDLDDVQHVFTNVAVKTEQLDNIDN